MFQVMASDERVSKSKSIRCLFSTPLYLRTWIPHQLRTLSIFQIPSTCHSLLTFLYLSRWVWPAFRSALFRRPFWFCYWTKFAHPAKAWCLRFFVDFELSFNFWSFSISCRYCRNLGFIFYFSRFIECNQFSMPIDPPLL